MIPERLAIQLANSTEMSAAKFYELFVSSTSTINQLAKDGRSGEKMVEIKEMLSKPKTVVPPPSSSTTIEAFPKIVTSSQPPPPPPPSSSSTILQTLGVVLAAQPAEPETDRNIDDNNNDDEDDDGGDNIEYEASGTLRSSLLVGNDTTFMIDDYAVKEDTADVNKALSN